MIGLDLIDGKLTFHGWRDIADQTKVTEVIQRMVDLGFSRILITDVNRDFVNHGPNTSLLSTLTQTFHGVKFTVAGTINTYEDIEILKSWCPRGNCRT